jgi:hypothetical protein
LELEPGARIVQSWQATDFPHGAGASRVTVTLSAQHDGKTLLVLAHAELPDGTAKGYEDGWKKFYFEPMHRYFTHKLISEAYAEAKKPAKAKAKPKRKLVAKAKKVVAKVKAKAKRARRVVKAIAKKASGAKKAAKKTAKKARRAVRKKR